MRVKVTYSVGLDEVPGLIKNIVSKNRKTLKEVCSATEIVSSTTGDLGPKSLDAISRACEELSVLLESFSDCKELLKGYLYATVPQENVGDLLEKAQQLDEKLGETKNDVES